MIIHSPLDLVRSRLSVATATIGVKGTSYIPAGSHLTIWGMTKKVFREEGGLRGLYRGLIPTAVVSFCVLVGVSLVLICAQGVAVRDRLDDNVI